MKDQETSPERTHNKSPFQSIRSRVQTEGNKSAEGIKKAYIEMQICCNKELEIMESQLKLENSFAKMKAELKAINIK